MRSAAMRRPATRRRTPRALGAAAAAAAHWVLALAVVFGVLHSGGRYYYCEAWGLMPFDPCAQAPDQGGRESPFDVLSEEHSDCCAVLRLGAMPQASQAAIPRVAAAPWVAVLPAPQRAEPSSDSETSRDLVRALARWRPPPRASNDTRAQLMVFLI
jgi:hypothetical protein